MTDAHCHIWDLLEFSGDAEKKRRENGVAALANSWNLEQFEYHKKLSLNAKENKAPSLFCSFALHPQLSPSFLKEDEKKHFSLLQGLELLQSLAEAGSLDAVGETGFDLYNDEYRAAEKIQEEMFASHLEIALKYNLPLVLHLRRAMFKIFPFSKELKKLPAVIFHSWPGTKGEGEALINRGINVFFSFGSIVAKNHKDAINSAAFFPAERILLETDAPYQPLRGKNFSTWEDLNTICESIAALRKEACSSCSSKKELEEKTAENFFRIFPGRLN